MDLTMLCIGWLWYIPPKASAAGPGMMVISVWIMSRTTGSMVFNIGLPSFLCASGLMKRSAMKRITITAISDSSSFIKRNWE